MSNTFSTISPIDGTICVTRAYATSDIIQSTLENGKTAQQSWKKVPLHERKGLCAKSIDAFVAKKDEIAEEICWQMGRPIRSAASEVTVLEERAQTMIYLADQGLVPVKLDKKPGYERWIQREPLGGVFVIAPWNYPYLTEVNHTMRVMIEESFGPIVGIQKVSSDEEAIGLMNDSEFGLTAAIFTRDIEKGIELGQQIDTGTFFINRCDYLDPGLAWTGIKNSGHGCTLSVLGYESLTRPKSFHIKTDI